jgi:hypothetical protein
MISIIIGALCCTYLECGGDQKWPAFGGPRRPMANSSSISLYTKGTVSFRIIKMISASLLLSNLGSMWNVHRWGVRSRVRGGQKRPLRWGTWWPVAETFSVAHCVRGNVGYTLPDSSLLGLLNKNARLSLWWWPLASCSVNSRRASVRWWHDFYLTQVLWRTPKKIAKSANNSLRNLKNQERALTQPYTRTRFILLFPRLLYIHLPILWIF